MENRMSETKDRRNSKKAERTLRSLNNAIVRAKKKYKDRHGEPPRDGHHYHLRDGMTREEELLEVAHALVRSGMSIDEAEEKAPAELERIHGLINNQE
jgi:hypothetical protein